MIKHAKQLTDKFEIKTIHGRSQREKNQRLLSLDFKLSSLDQKTLKKENGFGLLPKDPSEIWKERARWLKN